MQTDQERHRNLIVTAAVLTSVSGLGVLLRLFIRFFVILKAGWDDLTIFLAVIVTFGYLGELVVAKANGMGVPSTNLTLDEMVNFVKDVVAIEVTYNLIVGLVKISILFVYLRFALSRSFQYVCYGTIVFQFIFTIVCVVVTVAQCVPLSKMWDFAGTEVGTCINTTAFFYTISTMNIVTDVWILVLPMKTLISVKRPTREKIALVGIFGAGIFSTIVSIIRVQSIHIYTLSSDPIHDAIPINLWSMIEINTAILCASIPALKPLLSPGRLRKAVYDRRYGHDLDTGHDSIQLGSSRNELCGKDRLASNPNTSNLVRLTSNNMHTPATPTRKDEYEADVPSPVRTVPKEERSYMVSYMV